MALSRDSERMFSALGGGKLLNDVNQLIQAPEEEEQFDAWNDETFGDIGDVSPNFNWEDEHNRMAEELESSALFNFSTLEENQTRDSGFTTMDRGYSTTTQEDELERSIQQLVVDDADSTAFTANGQPIPSAQRRSHLDELFGPNSPPGYMDLESLTSPGKNIWGSPSGDGPFQKPVNNTLQALFASAKQAAVRDFPGVFPNPRSATSIRPPPSMPLPVEAQTLAEVENSMLARERHKPRVMTAEEVERQLRGDPPLSAMETPFTGPAQIPPLGTAVAFRKQLSQVPNQVPLNAVGTRIPNGESLPIAINRPENQPVHPSAVLPGSSPSPSPSPSHPLPGIPPGLVNQSPRLMSPYGPTAAFMANRMFGNAMSRPPPPTHVPHPNIASPFNSPYGSPSAAIIASRNPSGPPGIDQQSPPCPRMTYPSGRPYAGYQMPPPHPQQQPPPQQQHHHHHHMVNSGDRRGSGSYNSHPYNERRDHYFHNNNNYNRGGQHGNFHRHQYDNSEPQEADNDDEYAGLMTKKEKDWIIKIQLIQLQTENPYLDDFYFTYHSMKKKAADRNRQNIEGSSDRRNNEPEMLIPSMIKIEPRTYTPAQFEGSLGRLTAASVHNPRQIIDVCRNVSPTNEESGQKNVSRELRRFRQLLVDIEKGYNLILAVDDIEKKVLALPNENRLPLFEERLEKIQAVYDYFMQDDSLKNFLPTMSVRKGRKLLARLMPLLDKVQWLSIATVLLSHLPVLIKKDQEEEGLEVLLPPLSCYIRQCDLECLVHFATILQKHPKHFEDGLLLLLTSSFGMSLLSCLIKTGEEYFRKTSPVDIDNQLKTQWTQFIEEFVESLQTVPIEDLAWPSNPHLLVAEHVDRFINNMQIGSVEDKLARFSEPRTGQQPLEGSPGLKGVPTSS